MFRRFLPAAVAALACGSLAHSVPAQAPQKAAMSPFVVQPTQAYLPIFGMIEPRFRVDGKVVSLVKDEYHDTVIKGVHRFNGTPTQVTLWSQPLSAAPFDLTFEAGEMTETLKDSSGQVIWSQPSGRPSFILTLNKDNQASFADDAGTILWSGTLTRSEQGYLTNRGKVPNPYAEAYVTDLFRYLCGPDQITLQSADGQTLWQGKPERNPGLQVKGSDSGLTVVDADLGLTQLPVDTPLHIRLTSEPVTLSVSNRPGHPIRTLPYQLLRMTLVSDDPRFQDDMTASRYGLNLVQIQNPFYPTIKFAPKAAVYYVNYQDTQGRFLFRQKYRVTQITPTEAYLHLTPAQAALLSHKETFYRVLVADDVDANGEHRTYPYPCDFLEVSKQSASTLVSKPPITKQ